MVSKNTGEKAAANRPDGGEVSYDLSIGSADQISTLSKLHPILLPNQSPQLYESQALKDLRTSYKYVYVINWLYYCRGFIKLQSEYFDVDIFELELLNYFPSSSFLLNSEDQPNMNNLFIYKLKLHLITTLQNSKLSSINNFEKIFRLWFGVDTPLGGIEEEDVDEEDEEDEEEVVSNKRSKNSKNSRQSQNSEVDIKFDDLTITEKFDILYILISYIANYSSFRTWIDRNNLGAEDLRVDSLYTTVVSSSKAQEDYLVFFDGCRLYKRTMEFPSLVIPKKRKLAPENPDEFYNAEQFDVKPVIKFELVYKNIFELNGLMKEWSRKKSALFKTLYTKIKAKYVDAIFEAEIKKRRLLTNKKKEIQLASLLATRKRSSRLEAKEKQKQEELRLLQEQEEAELRLASEKRMERRRKMKFQTQNGTPDYTGGLSRDERLKLRKLATPEVETPEYEEVNVREAQVQNTGVQEANVPLVQEEKQGTNEALVNEQKQVIEVSEPVVSHDQQEVVQVPQEVAQVQTAHHDIPTVHQIEAVTSSENKTENLEILQKQDIQEQRLNGSKESVVPSSNLDTINSITEANPINEPKP